MTLQVHLNKSGSGMASKTACGRNILRTPISTNWDGFKTETHRCIKCEQSKQFEVNIRMDLAKWESEATDAWMAQDDAIIAAHKAKK
jgi:hypothetical protein